MTLYRTENMEERPHPAWPNDSNNDNCTGIRVLYSKHFTHISSCNSQGNTEVLHFPHVLAFRTLHPVFSSWYPAILPTI